MRILAGFFALSAGGAVPDGDSDARHGQSPARGGAVCHLRPAGRSWHRPRFR
ncbi:hypothetical protein SEA_SLIMJIMMY_54 [Mycobacterium phage SlimJimmy]|nr:hypothetical protein SEA_SLIMJIMMY_54 [Mycobacterium phage SlimJimmy]